MTTVCEPAATGYAERDGVKIAWASYGSGGPPVVLLPTWSIVPSRFWKAQVPYLARHGRVVTFDGRGSGASDRPPGAAAYTSEQYAADTLAVLDAAGVDRAVLVGFSCAANWGLHVAVAAPDRVLGLFALASSCVLDSDVHPEAHRFTRDPIGDPPRGWNKHNRTYWQQGGYPDYVDFFFGQLFNQPHSTKQIEDGIGWGLDLDVETAIATTEGRCGVNGAVYTSIIPLCAQVSCPVTVMHGTADAVNSFAVGERLAEVTGGRLIRVEGGGHGLAARDPVLVNREIRAFAEWFRPPAAARTWTRAGLRPPRVLYLSSPIGLGHARRDAAIAAELRGLRPDVHVDWLAQHPVTRVLAESGETVHPASAVLASESGHIEHESGEHDLHAFGAIRRMDEILVHNFGVFADVVAEQPYDLVVGDEAWDVDYFLHENPELKRWSYAWFTDFVGWLPMPDGGEREIALTADYNAEMIEQRARFRRLRDASIFVGDADDIVPDSFGPGLPAIRDWTEQNFTFSGYVSGIEPVPLAERARVRAALRVGDDERLCLVAVGGSGVGEPLLHRVLDAVPAVRRHAPDLRFVVVAGPRIDPTRLPRRRGARVLGYVPELYRHLAAADVAVVQGGLTTCMELTAARTPFLFVPLRHHFEQNLHVRHRLERYGAGQHLAYEDACDPDLLAERLLAALSAPVAYRPVATDGAARAARLLAQLI